MRRSSRFIEKMRPQAAAAARELGVDPRTHRRAGGARDRLGHVAAGRRLGRQQQSLRHQGRRELAGRSRSTSRHAGIRRGHRGRPKSRSSALTGRRGQHARITSRVIRDNPRYAAALNTGGDVRAFATALQRGGYATDPRLCQQARVGRASSSACRNRLPRSKRSADADNASSRKEEPWQTCCGTGLSSLRALQRALDTTGHNIANVSTPGYSRQRVNSPRTSRQLVGTSWIGNGVDVSQHRRYLRPVPDRADAARSSGNLARLDAIRDAGRRARQPVRRHRPTASRPRCRSSPTRCSECRHARIRARAPGAAVAGPRARAAAARLRQRLRDMTADIDARFAGEAARSDARRAGHRAAQRPDRRAPSRARASRRTICSTSAIALIDELATHVNVSVVAAGRRRTLNVFIGNGQSLVLGTMARITTQHDAYDPKRTSLAYKTPGGTRGPAQRLPAARVGGLLDFRREMLDPARNELGQISLAHRATGQRAASRGHGSLGALGGDLFAVGDVGVLPTSREHRHRHRWPPRAPTSAAHHRQRLRAAYAGNAWSLRRQDTGAAVTMTGTGTALDPFVADGLSLRRRRGRRPTAISSWCSPTRGAIDGLDVLITDPRESRGGRADPQQRRHAQHRHRRRSRRARCSTRPTRHCATPRRSSSLDATHYSVNGGGASDLHRRRQHRRERLARADRRRAGGRRHLHRGQQRRRHRRQPQCARAGRRARRRACWTAAPTSREPAPSSGWPPRRPADAHRRRSTAMPKQHQRRRSSPRATASPASTSTKRPRT